MNTEAIKESATKIAAIIATSPKLEMENNPIVRELMSDDTRIGTMIEGMGIVARAGTMMFLFDANNTFLEKGRSSLQRNSTK